MIPDENLGILEAARAIAAGRRVDWAAIESSAGISESLAALLRELKVVEGIAELHRSLPDPTDSESAASARGAESSVGEATAAPAVGAQIWGSLRLLERVGEGAFGDVYRAWDPRLDREVALKLLKRSVSTRDSVGSVVIDEGRLLARVRHPNVVTVYGADRIDGRVGLWMEFVRGRTLEAILRERGPFSAQEATLIGLDLCRALSAVHRAGLVHRDIKAQNVMREAGGRVVLMDFGTGREELGGVPTELAGTPLYLAPEVFAESPATARSDIYAVGVLLYHLVTSSYPITGRSVDDIREAHAHRRRTWLRDDRPELPDRFVQVVEQALESDPGLRYESAGAMEAALARVVSSPDGSGVEHASPAPLQARPAAIRLSAGKRVQYWLAAFAAAAIVVLAITASPAARSEFFGRVLRWRSDVGDVPKSESSVVVRKVTLPQGMLIGSPSADGTLFSVVDTTGNAAIVELATGQMTRVTTDAIFDRSSQYAEFTAISPDNRFVAYTWNALDGKSELRIVDARSKVPRVALRSDEVNYPVPIEWTRDGKWILATLARTDRAIQIALVSAEDGAVRVVKDVGPLVPQHASVSPDGRFVVYDAPERSGPGRDLFVVRSDGSDDRPLVEGPANDSNPVWTPDGRRVLFASDRSGTVDLWAVDVEAGFAHGEPQLVQRNMGRMWVRGLTDAGSYYYYLTVGAVDVYVAQLSNAGVTSAVTLPVSYTGSNISSVWSPDGRRVAFASRRGAMRDRASTTLAIRDIETQQQRELIPPMLNFLVRAWSPDATALLVQGEDARGSRGTYRVDVETGQVTPLAVGPVSSASDGRRADWLNDGRILMWNAARRALVARDVRTGADEVVFDMRAEGVDLIGNVNGRGYKLAPDGSTLAFTTAGGEGDAATHRIMLKVLGGGPARELARASGDEMVLLQDWTPDGTAVLFTRWMAKPDQPQTLWRASIYGGEPQSLGLSTIGLRDVSVNPDGTKITFTAGWPKNELWVMEHFLK